MASRTRIVCLCEGEEGKSVDPIFINRLLKTLKPAWLRLSGSNRIRLLPCGGRKQVMERLPAELKSCLSAGDNVTLMVWADCDDDCADPMALKQLFWAAAKAQAVSKEQFEGIVFIFAKDRIENWFEFLKTGATDESKEGPRLVHDREAADAAKELASMCQRGTSVDNMPNSLQWSCTNWRALVKRMTKS